MGSILRGIAIGACWLQAGLAFGGGAFEATGDMGSQRSHQGAALLADGRVLVVAAATRATRSSRAPRSTTLQQATSARLAA
jgi:hypothetical protein